MKNLTTNIYRSVFAVFCLFSCGDGNYENVVVSGVLKDEMDLPIRNAKITENCWAYSTKTWDSQSTDRIVFSDSSGGFTVSFKKGEAIDLQIIAEGFRPIEKSITLTKSMVNLEFSLEKE
ncbi:MAG: hypothetical protein ACK52I_31890 [Pseudomonadota bacterium]